MKSGYLYVLVHPSDPNLYKIGATTVHPEKRLAIINREHKEYAGRVVQDTGQKWELKTFIAVPDPNWAKDVFWGATALKEIPYQAGIEVTSMTWQLVQNGLAAAKKAGVRPPPKPRIHPVRDRDWMLKQLEGTGITINGPCAGEGMEIEFQCKEGHVFKDSALLMENRKSCPCCVDWNFSKGPRVGVRKSLR